jgi:hypothetical protein
MAFPRLVHCHGCSNPGANRVLFLRFLSISPVASWIYSVIELDFHTVTFIRKRSYYQPGMCDFVANPPEFSKAFFGLHDFGNQNLFKKRFKNIRHLNEVASASIPA